MTIDVGNTFVELTRGNGDILVWELVIPSETVGRAFDIVEATVYPCCWNEITGEQMAYNSCLSFDDYVSTLDPSGREGLAQELRYSTMVGREANYQLNRDLY